MCVCVISIYDEVFNLVEEFRLFKYLNMSREKEKTV